MSAKKKTKAKAKPAKKAKAAKKAAPKKAAKPKAAAAASAAASPAAPKVLKPLTMKQRLALIRVDPTTGKCPHGLVPETCSFCMNI
ncbi:MAG TPA: hypothetical protein VMV18_08935 [bacterium]|nr:hypothetical protein [bacterium]